MMDKMPQKDLRKLQLVELEMLLEVDRICREHDIKYCIVGGTMLGAVRHEGFIPWDDDLDIQMSRKEYEKFCHVCEKYLNKEKYFLQTYKTDKEYRWGYAKVRRLGTEYIRKGQEMIKCHSGVSIDIFPTDNFPDSTVERIIFHLVRRVSIKMLYSVIGVQYEKNLLKRIIYHIFSKIDKNVPHMILEKLAAHSNKKETEFVCCLSFYRNNKCYKDIKYMYGTIKAECLKNRKEIMFEGFPIYTSFDPMIYLQRKYTNIWECPPDEERTLHPPLSYNLDVDIDLRGKNIEDYMTKEAKFITEEEYLKSVKKGV